jgi:hypothetical protein
MRRAPDRPAQLVARVTDVVGLYLAPPERTIVLSVDAQPVRGARGRDRACDQPDPRAEWNAGAGPFTWVKTADEILAKAVRKTQADSGARH